MNINEFVNERKGEWSKLEEIAGKISNVRKPKINKDELWELSRLYSATMADLAIIRSVSRQSNAAQDVLDYLNKLAPKVHGIIYKRPPLKWSMIWEFFSIDFPSAVRRELPYLMVSIGIFVFFAVSGVALGFKEPEFIPLLVSDGIIDTVESGNVWFKDLYGIAPAASVSLMSHNISVTFLVIASGITFGIGTVYLMGLNGLMIGVVAALCEMHGLSKELWAFVLPHGAFELTAIFLGGAAGLIIGHGLADPGPYKRSEALKYCGKRSADLIFGLIAMLIIAGMIEAYFSPSPLPSNFKLVVAALEIILIGAYFSFAGGKKKRGTTEKYDDPPEDMGRFWEKRYTGISQPETRGLYQGIVGLGTDHNK